VDRVDGKPPVDLSPMSSMNNAWRFQQILPASLKLKPTVEKLIDNNVIEHADFQDPGSLGRPAGQPGISIAGCRIGVSRRPQRNAGNGPGCQPWEAHR
jgi:hypothetical protein